MRNLIFKSTIMVSIIALFAMPNLKAQHSMKKMDDMVKTQAITFQKGKVYDLALLDIKPGMEGQLQKDYLPNALPIAGEYGGKMIAGFGVIKSHSESLSPTMIGIFEWPNLEAREKVINSKAFKKIVHLRDEAVNSIHVGFFEVEETTSVEFKSNKVYEMGGASLFPTEEAQANLQEYFKVSEPIKRSYGGTYPEFVVNFKPVDAKGEANYTPQMQFIVEWDSVEDNEKLFANQEFKTKAAPLMMKAVKQADFIFTKFTFNE